jgi:hypothetical protein
MVAKMSSAELNQLRNRIVAKVSKAPRRAFYYGWPGSEPVRGVYLGQYFQRFWDDVAKSRVYATVLTLLGGGTITTLYAEESLVRQLKPVPVGSLVVIYHLYEDGFIVKWKPWKECPK